MVDETWHRYFFPSTIECGAGCAAAVGERLTALDVSRPLVVSDPGVVEAGLVGTVLESIQKAGLHSTLFAEVRPNPTDKNVYAGTVRFQDGRCDGIVAVGGGSVIDAAKAIRILVSHSCALQELYADAGGMTRIRRPMPPLISVPTTAGTGSEVSRVSVITDTAMKRKRAIVHPRLTSTIALLDPELTLHLSPFLTKTTGADALVHCIEGFAATTFDPIADGIALEGIRLIRENLPRVLAEPEDTEARARMLLAASMGALAFQKGGGGAHALANPLSELADIPHGLANAIVLPAVIRFNIPAAAERYARIADAIGVDDAGLSVEEAAHAVADAVEAFLKSLDIPLSLSEVGVDRDLIPELAAEAMRDTSHLTNPRECTERDLRALYEAVYERPEDA